MRPLHLNTCMTRTYACLQLKVAPTSWVLVKCVFSKSYKFISLRYFNQLDATSKVMYQHEVIYTGNTAQFYLFADIAVAASLWKIRE